MEYFYTGIRRQETTFTGVMFITHSFQCDVNCSQLGLVAQKIERRSRNSIRVQPCRGHVEFQYTYIIYIMTYTTLFRVSRYCSNIYHDIYYIIQGVPVLFEFECPSTKLNAEMRKILTRTGCILTKTYL